MVRHPIAAQLPLSIVTRIADIQSGESVVDAQALGVESSRQACLHSAGSRFQA